MTSIIITSIICIALLSMYIINEYFDYKREKMRLENAAATKELDKQERQQRRIEREKASKDNDWIYDQMNVHYEPV